MAGEGYKETKVWEFVTRWIPTRTTAFCRKRYAERPCARPRPRLAARSPPAQIPELPPIPTQKYREGAYCFLCEHTHQTSAANPFDKEDVEQLTEQLKRILSSWQGSHRPETAVRMAHDFYETKVRSVHTYLPPWPKEEIYNHIMYHTQDANAGISNVMQILETQIDALQSVTWERTQGPEQPPEPNLPNIRTLQSLIRTYYDGVRLRKSVA